MDTTATYTDSYYKQSSVNMTAISSELSKKEIRATILLAAVAFHGPLLLFLSSRQRRSANPVSRFLLWSLSATYNPLMTSVLSYLTTYIPAAGGKATAVLVLVILVQFLRAKVDMAAMAVAAVVSPAVGDDDVNSLRIRPSTESFINTIWVAVLVIYNIFSVILKHSTPRRKRLKLLAVTLLVSPLWVLGACRMVLSFVAFQRATRSFALGRNVQLVDGYLLQLREEADREMAAAQAAGKPGQQVPRLIVTGERDQDVDETPVGYRVKPSSLQQGSSSRLVTLDRVWSPDNDGFLRPVDKDLCLSFALFKCLRRRFAGYQLAAEADSNWAFPFVCDGLLLRRRRVHGENNNNDADDDDYRRVFKVIGTELSFVSDLFHSALPVASLGTTAAALHFVLSLLIFPSFVLLAVALVVYPRVAQSSSYLYYCRNPLVWLEMLLTVVNAGLEVRAMVASVRSNWTKISITGHIVRYSRHDGARRFLAWLLRRCQAPEFWHDKVRQTQLLKPELLVVVQPTPWACSSRRRLRLRDARRLLSRITRGRDHDDKIEVPLEVKEAILVSLRRGGGHLSDGTAAIGRHALARGNDSDIAWACRRDGGDVDTITDAILVWHIATTLFDMKCSSCRSEDYDAGTNTTPAPASVVVNGDDSKSKAVVVACCLSRYCMYLVAEAPELLPDNPAWTKRLYEAVKKRVEETPKYSGDESSSSSSSLLYQHLVDTFSGRRGDGDGEHSHEVLLKGARLGKQLVEEAEIRRRRSRRGGREARSSSSSSRAQAEDEVWALLADFWSEMVLYLAPSDNVKAHIEALQRGGELITLLWALLLHAGITSRPAPVEKNFTA